MKRYPNSTQRRRPGKRSRRRRGAVAVLLALLMVVLVGTAAFSVDIAYGHLVRAELRASTDAAAKAAVGVLAETEDESAARRAAMDIAAANPVAGRPLILESGDIVFGSGQLLEDGTFQFVPGQTPYGAARVTGRGAGAFFFGGVLGTPDFEAELSVTATRLNRDISLVVDRSGSMKGQALKDLKHAVTIFLATLEETSAEEVVGLASYSTNAKLEQELTTDLARIERVMTRMNAGGWTNIGGGIDTGRIILEDGHGRDFAEKTMIVMTDGRHNRGTDPIEAAHRAADEGIVIHAITFGSGADQDRMRQVAEIGGGKYYHAPNGATLQEIYREIALSLRTILTE